MHVSLVIVLGLDLILKYSSIIIFLFSNTVFKHKEPVARQPFQVLKVKIRKTAIGLCKDHFSTFTLVSLPILVGILLTN